MLRQARGVILLSLPRSNGGAQLTQPTPPLASTTDVQGHAIGLSGPPTPPNQPSDASKRHPFISHNRPAPGEFLHRHRRFISTPAACARAHAAAAWRKTRHLFRPLAVDQPVVLGGEAPAAVEPRVHLAAAGEQQSQERRRGLERSAQEFGVILRAHVVRVLRPCRTGQDKIQSKRI